MSAVATETTETKRMSIWQLLFPSVFTGILFGAIGAAVCGFIVAHVVTPPTADNLDYAQDATAVAAYLGWVVCFFIGIGAFGGVWKWGFGRREETHAKAMQLAGKDQGLWRYFRYTTDHKVVGMQYLTLVFFTFLLGSTGAFMIRLEQSQPGAIFFTPTTYNTIVGMHGILMIVSTIIMVSGPFGNFILPIMIGARDMAFPRLNALSFWLLFSGVPVFISALFLGGFQTGWTGYAPLADQGGPGMDAYAFLIIIFALSTS